MKCAGRCIQAIVYCVNMIVVVILYSELLLFALGDWLHLPKVAKMRTTKTI
jgi:hypothetical protein